MANKKVLDNQCPACKAPIVFNAKSGKFDCEYCGNSFTVNELNSAASKASLDNKTKEVEEDTTEYISYNCPDCGAQVVCDENTAATFCVYCGNTNIIKNRLEGKFAPDKIIPFRKAKEDAISAFKSLKKGRPFLPKEFTLESNIEKITGVYIPFWLYDIKVSGSYNLDGKVVTSWTSGDMHYTKTDTYKYYRTGSMNLIMVPVDGSTKFDNDIMNTIEPFDFKELEEYNHAYLSGFLAERYDVSSEDAFSDANIRALNSAREEMSNGASPGAIPFEDTLASEIVNKYYVLLPVWMVNTKYEDKYYLFAMNGQTGEFVGNMPINIKKAIVFGIGIFVLVGLLITLISYFVYLGGSAL